MTLLKSRPTFHLGIREGLGGGGGGEKKKRTRKFCYRTVTAGALRSSPEYQPVIYSIIQTAMTQSKKKKKKKKSYIWHWVGLSLINNNNRIERRNSRFFTISSLRRELSPTRMLKWPGRDRVQIMCNTSSAYHVQHAVCHFVRRDSSAIKFDRAEIAFMLAFSLLAETINR